MQSPGRWSRRQTRPYAVATTGRVIASKSGSTGVTPSQSIWHRAPEWLMAAASVATAALALASLYVATGALKSQSAALAQQSARDEEERAARAEDQSAREAENAKKVTWWASYPAETLYIRNASNEELIGPHVAYNTGANGIAYVMAPSVPPCTTLSLPLDDPAVKRFDVTADLPMSVTFGNSAGSWTRQLGGGPQHTRAEAEPYLRTDLQQGHFNWLTAKYAAIEGCT
jgi:hypothetical protein